MQEVDRWATDDNVKKAVEKPLASEAERQAHVPWVRKCGFLDMWVSFFEGARFKVMAF